MPGVLWRGTRVSTDMVAPLDELARLSGDDIYVKPIAGFGSYSDNAASVDIDSGGGHVDINLVGLTGAQKTRLERIARMVGFYADIREPRWWSPIRSKFMYATWQSHLHMMKKDTPDRSTAARAQLASWYSGTNGMAGFTFNGKWTHDPDDGPREFLYQTWTQYTTSLEDDMPTVEEIWQRPVLRAGGKVPAIQELADTKTYALEIKAQLAGLTGAVNALATTQGLDPAKVSDIIKAAVDGALSDLRIVNSEG